MCPLLILTTYTEGSILERNQRPHFQNWKYLFAYIHPILNINKICGICRNPSIGPVHILLWMSIDVIKGNIPLTADFVYQQGV